MKKLICFVLLLVAFCNTKDFNEIFTCILENQKIMNLIPKIIKIIKDKDVEAIFPLVMEVITLKDDFLECFQEEPILTYNQKALDACFEECNKEIDSNAKKMCRTSCFYMYG